MAKNVEPSSQIRLEQALAVLRALDLPEQQQNERSALTLLALLDLKPETPWSGASSPLRGITPMMDFFAQHYGKRYAPNSRETVRRYTVHQFLQAGLVVQNPDDPSRPVNSGKNVYQIKRDALQVIRTYGTEAWEKHLRQYLNTVLQIRRRYRQTRDIKKIPLTLPSGVKIKLSPGGQNVLVKKIIEEFCPRFAPGARPVYVGDAGDKWAYFDGDALRSVGVVVEEHGKIPDVVVYHEKRNWLLLIEAVTSHGPVDSKRRSELLELFKASSAGLVFVTAFLDRETLKSYLAQISWETEVWVANDPDHMIHFNGERFLGPYEHSWPGR